MFSQKAGFLSALICVTNHDHRVLRNG